MLPSTCSHTTSSLSSSKHVYLGCGLHFHRDLHLQPLPRPCPRLGRTPPPRMPHAVVEGLSRPGVERQISPTSLRMPGKGLLNTQVASPRSKSSSSLLPKASSVLPSAPYVEGQKSLSLATQVGSLPRPLSPGKEAILQTFKACTILCCTCSVHVLEDIVFG